MKNLHPLLVFGLVVMHTARLLVASDFPTASAPIPDQSIPIGGSVSIDLRNHFQVTGITGQVVQVQLVYGSTTGTFNMEMLPSAAPVSVSNFLDYVNAGSYTNTLIHRSDQTLGVIQGGGYVVSPPNINHVATNSPIQLEYNLPNIRGTVSMARTSALNSATSEWFVNTVDNTTNLGQSNGGGYAVFARVTGTGMSVVDNVAALQVYDASGSLGSAFGQMPLSGYSGTGSLTLSNTVLVTSAKAVPVFPAQAGGSSVVSFGGSNSNPETIAATLNGSILTFTGLPGKSGTTTASIIATDTNGNNATSTVNVSAYTGWHYATLSSAGNAYIGGKRTGLASSVYSYLYYYKGVDNNVWALFYDGSKWAQVALSSGGNVDDWFSESPGYNQLYYRGTDGHIYAVWYGGGQWNQAALTLNPNAAGDIQTDSVTNFTYYRGNDGNLWVLWYGGGKWNQVALTSSGNVAGDIVVDNVYHFAYYRGTDSHLRAVWFGGGQWNNTALSTSANVAGKLVADPGWGVYYQDGSATEWALWFNGTQWVQSNLGVATGSVSGLMSLYGHLGLIYTGTDGAVRYFGYFGASWGIATLVPTGLGLTDTPVHKASEGLTYERTADGKIGLLYYQ